MDLQELSDRIKIADLLTRYADAVDRRLRRVGQQPTRC